MKRKLIALLLLVALNVEVAHAQFFKKLTDAAGSIVNTGVKVVTAQPTAIINTGRVIVGDARPSEIYKPYQELARSTGRTVGATTEVINDPRQFIFNRAQQFAALGGKPGEFIFDVGTFTNQIYTELAIAGLHNTSGILQGQNILQLSAIPLAAALRAARERHLQGARPLPDDVKAALKGHFSDSTLSRAKYSVGDIQITLPNFIGKGKKLFDQDAVVVDDIIVFRSPPPAYQDNPCWWSHEVTHVQQYEKLGVEAFAYQYLKDKGGAIESEADNNARRVTGRKCQNNDASQLRADSFDMTGANYGIDYQKNPEYYVAQCVFPSDPYRVNYLVTNYGRIIAVDPLTGNWLHLGFATPPLAPGVAWTYQTPNLRYAVSPEGGIYTTVPVFDWYGRISGYNYYQIGHVIRFG